MKRDMKSLTADELRAVISYDPETGKFVWLRSAGSRARAGASAGWPSGYGYIGITVNGCKHRAHRLAWLYVHGAWPNGEIDHINGDRRDNRLANLRDVTCQQNRWNKTKSHGRTGLVGVQFDPRDGRYYARIHANGKTYALGGHATPELARAAYLAAKRTHHPGILV